MSNRWSALGVLTLGVLLIGVDGTALAVSTPFITADLNAGATDVLWIGDIYSFVLASLLVTMGSLGDRIGHRKLLLSAAVTFGFLSLAAAYASSVGLLIGTRALLGVAGAALAPSTLALIRGLFPQARERTIAVGIWASGFSAGSALGPVIGGVLLEHFWWGSVFLVNLPVVAVLIVGGTALVPELSTRNRGPWDMPGAGLFLTGTLGFMYSVKEAAAQGISAGIVVTGAVGIAALTLFFRRQLRLRAPLVDLRLFRNRAFSGVVGANLLAMLGLSGVIFFLSQFFQLVDGYSPMKAGLAESPAAVGAAAFGVLAAVARRFWSSRAVLTGGLALVGVAMASLTLIHPSTAYPQLGTALFGVGVGLGLVYTVANDVILASVPAGQSGAAAAISETSFELGMALGVASLGSVVGGVYRGMAVPPGTPDAVAAQATETLIGAQQVAATLAPVDARELLTAAQSAFTQGLAVAAGVGSALLLASAVAVWTLLRPQPADHHGRLNRPVPPHLTKKSRSGNDRQHHNDRHARRPGGAHRRNHDVGRTPGDWGRPRRYGPNGVRHIELDASRRSTGRQPVRTGTRHCGEVAIRSVPGAGNRGTSQPHGSDFTRHRSVARGRSGCGTPAPRCLPRAEAAVGYSPAPEVVRSPVGVCAISTACAASPRRAQRGDPNRIPRGS